MTWNLTGNDPKIQVLTAVIGAHEGKVAELIAGAQPTMTLARRCADVAELLATAHVGLGTVAVISSDLPGLDRHLVHTLGSQRVGLIVLNSPLDQLSVQRLAALGITESLAFSEMDRYLLDSIQRSHERVTTRSRRAQPGGTQPHDAYPSSSRTNSSHSHGVYPYSSDAVAPPPSGPPPSVPSPHGPAPNASAAHASAPHGSAPHGSELGGTELDYSQLLEAGAGTMLAQNASAGLDLKEPPESESMRSGPGGRVITVWGTAGAPGRSTVAANLAYALARGNKPTRRRKRVTTPGKATLLIDADTYNPALTQMLGLLDEGSGLARACHTAGQGLLSPQNLPQQYARLEPNLDLLTGISRTTRWPEITGVNLEAILYQAKYIHDWIITDCAAPTESDEILSFDTVAPQRNGATLCAITESDCVVVVGKGDPVGLKRLIEALAEAQDNPAFDGVAMVVVVNQVRGSTAGTGTKAAITAMLSQYAHIQEPLFIPFDAPAVDRSLMLGRAVLDNDPGSSVAGQFHRLADLIQKQVGPRTRGEQFARANARELGW